MWISGHHDVLVFLKQFLWMVSTDPIGVWGLYTNPLTAWFLEVAHNVDGSRWSQCLVCNVSTTEFLCVAQWNVWRHLQSSSWFAAYPLSFVCRRLWGLSYSLLEWSVSAISSLHVITDVQLHGLIKPHRWKCPILSEFHQGYMIHVWHFQYGQERGQWE